MAERKDTSFQLLIPDDRIIIDYYRSFWIMLQILALLGNTEPSEKDGCGVCLARVSVTDNALGVIHSTEV